MLLIPKSPQNQRVIKSPLISTIGRKMGPGLNSTKKKLPRFTAKQPRMKIIINLKTNNYVINKKLSF